jgi:hypothetical protein
MSIFFSLFSAPHMKMPLSTHLHTFILGLISTHYFFTWSALESVLTTCTNLKSLVIASDLPWPEDSDRNLSNYPRLHHMIHQHAPANLQRLFIRLMTNDDADHGQSIILDYSWLITSPFLQNLTHLGFLTSSSVWDNTYNASPLVVLAKSGSVRFFPNFRERRTGPTVRFSQMPEP